MGYYYKVELETAVPPKSWVIPKTHTPDPQVSERGHRFYQPESGRWVNRDPIGERGDPNLYANVRNSPIAKVDPLGLTGVATVNDYKDISTTFYVSLYFNVDWAPPTSGDWNAPVGCKPCRKVVPIQSIDMTLLAFGFPSYAHVTADEYLETDPENPSKNHWIDGSGTGPSSHARLGDAPQAFRVLIPFISSYDSGHGVYVFTLSGTLKAWFFEATTSFRCVEGKDAGTTYAAVKWGLKYYDPSFFSLGGAATPDPFPAIITY